MNCETITKVKDNVAGVKKSNAIFFFFHIFGIIINRLSSTVNSELEFHLSHLVQFFQTYKHIKSIPITLIKKIQFMSVNKKKTLSELVTHSSTI